MEVIERKKMGIVESWSLAGMLGILSLEDLKTHKIRDILVLGFAIVGVFLHIIYQRMDILSIAGGLLVGAFIALISFLSEGRIGMGDAFVLMLTGIFLGFWDNIVLLWVSLTLMSLYGIVLVVFKRKGRDYRVPYVPFIFAGFLILSLMQRGLN